MKEFSKRIFDTLKPTKVPNLPFLLCFTLYSRANSKYKPPGGAYIRRGDLTEGFLRHDFGWLIHGGAYFRNFTVTYLCG